MDTPTPPSEPRELHRQTLLGIACADALGAATEFRSAAEVAQQWTPADFDDFQPGSPFGFAPGEATDDSQMVVAHLLRPDDPGAGYRQWLATGPADVGNLTRQALDSSAFEAWEASGRDSAGNGGLMRVAACFLTGARGEDLLARAVADTTTTHVDPRCVLASLVLVSTMDRLAEGEDYPVAVTAALEVVRRADVAALVEATGTVPAPLVDGYRTPGPAFAAIGQATMAGMAGAPGPQSGYVVHTLQQALRFGAAESWQEGIVPVVMAGDDSDTTAAVTAALLGAKGLRPPESLAQRVRLGASWPDWKREWLLHEHLDSLLG